MFYFLRRRGEEVLSFVAENEIEGVYVNFPDPWEENERIEWYRKVSLKYLM